METNYETESLDSNRVDYLVSVGKGAAGLVPIIGPVFAEIFGITIPNQRVDRVVRFSRELSHRLQSIENHLWEPKLENEEFTDLIECSFIQAARSITDDRRSYIASLVTNGLSSDTITCSESKHLLRILDEISDIEIVWLRFYLNPYMGSDTTFRETHEDILAPVLVTNGTSKAIRDKSTFQDSYREHLCQLGLLEKRYDIDHKTGLPEFDRMSGSMKERGYQITSLGRLLLEEIGQGEGNGS